MKKESKLVITSIMLSSLVSTALTFTLMNSANTYANTDELQSTGKLTYENPETSEQIVIDTSDHELLQTKIDENTTSIETNLTSIENNTLELTELNTKVANLNNKVLLEPTPQVTDDSELQDSPIGQIISHMGNAAPAHYLICDGSVYNIVDYPQLAEHFTKEFGKANYFGGDGVTTFAVPDLRGEFLRGTGTGDRQTGTGDEVGIHQDGTAHMWLASMKNSKLSFRFSKSEDFSMPNYDSVVSDISDLHFGDITATDGGVSGMRSALYTSRPTNTAVLYCIKYEPTYFMKVSGLRQEKVLFEGTINRAGTYELTDSVENYDTIIVMENTNNEYYTTKEVLISNGMYGSALGWSAGNSTNYFIYGSIKFTDNSAYIRHLDISKFNYHIYKIIGVKYNYTSDGTGSSN